MIKSDTLRDSSSTPRVLQREESGWVQAPYIYIYTHIYWHYAACSNRTRGSLFNPTRAVYLCAHECLRYAMKGLSRRYNCTPNLSADSDASTRSLPFVCLSHTSGDKDSDTLPIGSSSIFLFDYYYFFSSIHISTFDSKLDYKLLDY